MELHMDLTDGLQSGPAGDVDAAGWGGQCYGIHPRGYHKPPQSKCNRISRFIRRARRNRRPGLLGGNKTIKAKYRTIFRLYDFLP